MQLVVNHISGKKTYCAHPREVRIAIEKHGPGRMTLLSVTHEEMDAYMEERRRTAKARHASA